MKPNLPSFNKRHFTAGTFMAWVCELTEGERKLLVMRLEGATHEEVGRQFGFTRERSSQIEQKAWAKAQKAWAKAQKAAK